MPPDFPNPELNELADLIRTSLSSVQESLDREHSFLHYASHELRTPITIIRNNIELLHKIKEHHDPERIVQQEKVIDRIDRANLNMQYLTETLLWLSRQKLDWKYVDESSTYFHKVSISFGQISVKPMDNRERVSKV